jgi:hypothetical protein
MTSVECGARSRSRTGMPLAQRGILSPMRLPISPSGRWAGRNWRRGSESNRRRRLCRPLHNHFATPPRFDRALNEKGKTESRLRLTRYACQAGAKAIVFPGNSGAGKESRTPDLNLGKVALYQLSYSRGTGQHYSGAARSVKLGQSQTSCAPPCAATPFSGNRPSTTR